ncbi:MAG TPA: glycerol acyltransferase [Bacteroidales bacterium]|nr:glycerol acyltransferase [Bacteroidales bacterium]HPF03176.1 glycerol acyltransferase [Bacteroidales bacterium]HPJ58120.1 glycerol acyltransferase [Bacteroidales bacterium]HPR12465.1 glycerol acyltransferase [Bacteroidales bacterium]HRW84530.1 glycerol acyltransferase [Bacteroidales bacterium]
MNGSKTAGEPLQIDVGEVLRTKNPSLAKAVPGFLIRYLSRIIHQDDINMILRDHGHLRDTDFIRASLETMGISYTVAGSGNIPSSGRYFFVSNHPLGGLDGLVFMNELGKYYSNIKFPVNDLLMNLKNLSGIFLPVNKHGAQAKDAIRLLEETFASDSQILYFPAGLCSRKKAGSVRDLKWHKTFITKAIQHKRDVIPAYFSGRNSDFFYNLSNLRTALGIKANIEMLFLPHEMFSQKEKSISLVFGEKIPWQTFDSSKSHSGWAEWVMSKTYELESAIK